jgi:stage II sporulation protein M
MEHQAPPQTRQPILRDFLSKLRKWGGHELFCATGAFVIGTLVGVLVALIFLENSSTAKDILALVNRSKHEELAVFAHWKLHFLHNIKLATILILSGIVARWIPISLTALNGFVVGLACAVLMMHFEVSFIYIVGSLAPHGVFEVPAILLASAAGARIPRVAQRRTLTDRVRVLVGTWKAFLVITGLLVVAAAVEIRTAF